LATCQEVKPYKTNNKTPKQKQPKIFKNKNTLIEKKKTVPQHQCKEGAHYGSLASTHNHLVANRLPYVTFPREEKTREREERENFTGLSGRHELLD